LLNESANPRRGISVMIVDDHPLMRVGVAAIIDAQPDMCAVAQAGTAEEAIALHDRYRPDVTLMDLRLPDASGASAIRRIRARRSEAKFVVLTTYEGDEDIHQALESGAQGYIIKGMPHEVLIQALKRVHAGKRYLPSPVARALESRTPDAKLSAREREVLGLLVSGKSNKEIAATLGISEATVKCHFRVIFMRMGVTDRTQAVVAAIKRGLVHV
jgi:DNA-binding NarL/FixJ family response regulator